MIKGIYTIHDQLSETCLEPFFYEYFHDDNDKHCLACRLFDEVVASTPLMSSNKCDFDLYVVGSYDTETGEVNPCRHELVKRGVDCA